MADFETILKSLPKGTKLNMADFTAQTIAQLGEEGWEMVGITVSPPSGSGRNFYFKRPKQ